VRGEKRSVNVASFSARLAGAFMAVPGARVARHVFGVPASMGVTVKKVAHPTRFERVTFAFGAI